jgi:hypothetical protein
MIMIYYITGIDFPVIGVARGEQPRAPDTIPNSCGTTMSKNQLAMDFNDSQENEEIEEQEEEKRNLLFRISSFKLDALQDRVAWLLNNYPETRNSDITLQIEYWKHFESHIFNGEHVSVPDLYNLTRLTSIARARAKIQNTYKLFLADEPIRAHRGTLEKAEKNKAVQDNLFPHTYSVFADESGKTGKTLIVGSVWFLNPYETYRMATEMVELKKRNKYEREFHFKDIDKANLRQYELFADFLKEHNSFISLKAISVERNGVSSTQDAFIKLFYHLLVRGINHEHSSGRAPLPRTVNLWKDAEEGGYDKLLLSEVKDRLKQSEKSMFSDKLRCGMFESSDSKGNHLIQIADLFTGSLNRVFNTYVDGTKAKDKFAEYFLELFGIDHKQGEVENTDDLAVHMFL